MSSEGLFMRTHPTLCAMISLTAGLYSLLFEIVYDILLVLLLQTVPQPVMSPPRHGI